MQGATDGVDLCQRQVSSRLVVLPMTSSVVHSIMWEDALRIYHPTSWLVNVHRWM